MLTVQYRILSFCRSLSLFLPIIGAYNQRKFWSFLQFAALEQSNAVFQSFTQTRHNTLMWNMHRNLILMHGITGMDFNAYTTAWAQYGPHAY